jgi:CRP-like cAMP-binding protein
LEAPHTRIETVYFLATGFASVVAAGPGKRTIEVGIIGREGMTGLPVVLGHDRSRHETYIQVPATGHCISAAKLRAAIAESSSLHRSLLRCAHAFLLQTAETAIANGRSKNEERLARWLLMAHDRIDGRDVPLSHKLLAVMLGVHRPAVTVALHALERRRLIRPGRESITILNRKGLVAFSRGAYVVPEPV